MILNLIPLMMIPLQLQATEPLKTCESKKLILMGYYGDKGENKSPLLETWSEVSGDLKKIEFKSKDKIQNIKLLFLDEQQKEILQKTIAVKNNTTDSLSLVLDYKNELPKTKTLKLVPMLKNTEFCQSEITIIKVDGEGPLE